MSALKPLVALALLTALVGCASMGVNGVSSRVTTKTIEQAAVQPWEIGRIRVEIWTGCLCGGPTHGNTYEELERQRDKRMLFGQEYQLAITDRDLDPIAFLVRHLPEEKKALADHVFKGVAYHPKTGGRSYVKYQNGLLWKVRMGDLKPGDLLVCYPEVY